MTEELKKNGSLYNYEITTILKTNEELHLLCNIKEIVDSNGNIIGREGILRDITQLKNAEQELRANELKLKELNATKDKFFSILAHDLKNPFSGILGISELLVNSAFDLEKEKIIQQVGFINKAAQSAYKLLENLLEWSKTQTGIINFKPEVFSIHDLLQEVLYLLDNFMKHKNIALNLIVKDVEMIKGDRNMLNTIFRNLLTNAIKFTNRNGKISINIEQQDSKIQIYIMDNGVGMSEETIHKLFKISEKYSSIGTEGESGTGLGLLICKEFVEKHGGKIWVKSEQGSGSSFNFCLPA